MRRKGGMNSVATKRTLGVYRNVILRVLMIGSSERLPCEVIAKYQHKTLAKSLSLLLLTVTFSRLHTKLVQVQRGAYHNGSISNKSPKMTYLKQKYHRWSDVTSSRRHVATSPRRQETKKICSSEHCVSYGVRNAREIACTSVYSTSGGFPGAATAAREPPRCLVGEQ